MSIVVIKQTSYMYNKAFDQFKTHNYLINFQNKKLFDISWTFFLFKYIWNVNELPILNK